MDNKNLTKKEVKPKKESKAKKIIRFIILIIALCLIGYASYNLYTLYSEGKKAKDLENELTSIVGDVDTEGVLQLNKEKFDELHAINSDFIGWLSFESDLINQPVMFSGDDYYLHRSFKKEYLQTGTVYLEKTQNIHSQNMTFYGHLVYRDSTLMFSLLHELVVPENYEQHKNFSFSMETEVRNYVVSHVYFVNVYEDIYYYIGDFTPETFALFKNDSDKRAFYDTGVEINYEDKFITLQTCVKWKPDLRLIVVGKEVSRVPYE